MTITEALQLIHDRYQGSIKPYDGLELDTVFCFFVVDKNDDPIGNGAQFVVSKDGELFGFRTIGQALPDKYVSSDSSVRRISSQEITSIWNKHVK
jgi:hypothetical protein